MPIRANALLAKFYAMKVKELDLEINKIYTLMIGDAGPDEIASGEMDARIEKASEATAKMQYQRKAFRQMPLIARATQLGIDIPESYWEPGNFGLSYKPLNHQGYSWLVREIGKNKLSTVKDWVSVISPILSSIIAILGLLVALRRH
ncbi:hypothetical protein HDF12_001985 [Edaphobacter lichenicola]|uniref:Uncharacterized protein n=2 Tax=Tunturiibacter TaxID=3154218 RepID=A0A7Y9NMP3_9BACT|nr:hypothetical protein [Edaphobacter lichenicola]